MISLLSSIPRIRLLLLPFECSIFSMHIFYWVKFTLMFCKELQITIDLCLFDIGSFNFFEILELI